MLKTFFFGLFIGVLCMAVAFFSTPDLTNSCSDSFMICLDEGLKSNFVERVFGTLSCVINNVMCVVGRLF